MRWHGIVTSSVSLSYTYNTINNPLRPRTGKEYTVAFQVGRHLAATCGTFRRWWPTSSSCRCTTCIPSANGRNVLGLRAQLGYVQGFGGDVAPPKTAFTPAAKATCAASTSAAPRPTAMFPTASTCS